MTNKFSATATALVLGMFTFVFASGCDEFTIPDFDDVLNGNENVSDNDNDNTGGGATDTVEFEVVATNTAGATGIALRPSDGALFAVNSTGLYGPIVSGDDFSAMVPIGATNLSDPDLFDTVTSNLVLAITNSGEFWIGSSCCVTMAVVPAQGGDADPYQGLLSGALSSTVKPETLLIVPGGFEGDQMVPERLLAGLETTFSWLAAIDVEGDRTAMDVDNPGSINRNAHHLTFGLDGVLYSARGVPGLTITGFQTIDPDGMPHPLEGMLAMAAESFVALENGDLIIRGTHQTGPTTVDAGILLYNAADQEITFAKEIPTDQRSEDDEMIITPDGSTIYLSLPARNEIVIVQIIE